MSDHEDLARQLVAHERWEYRDGLVLEDGGRVVAFDAEPDPITGPHSATVHVWAPKDGESSWCYADELPPPNLEHHATQGCLLGMLREVCTELKTASECDHTGVESHEVLAWVGDGAAPLVDCPTLGEALARALLAAWGDAGEPGGRADVVKNENGETNE